MERLRTFMDSGLLEAYMLGFTDEEENVEVEEMISLHPEVRLSMDRFNDSLERTGKANAVAPDPTIRPFFLATLNFTQRMMTGEQPAFPPELQTGASIADYEQWLTRPDMVLPNDFTDLYARIIGYTPQMTTAIVWIKEMAPQEVHDNEFEKFLIVEGTCDITIGSAVHSLVPGDYLAIPLHEHHFVTVTSQSPCKVILQRVAA